MSTLSTHVLDAALGVPAAGLDLVLRDASGSVLEEARTDADGRVRFAATVDAGDIALEFATGPWFAAAGRDTLYPVVRLDVTVDGDRPHHHLALLLAPYSYTTYRGS
ncbi:hydroxyisourate hydrolase [Phycicoccus flavus]|uniref:hydroxyisourate hydrolase n=1 Tax=Phycicoccus flavus TaxID=2502783 RepID=UPI000FEB7ABD|nr:hydroxyisourate hydrolase [Phycicoccus flavus]NHA67109.1 hydroxyisourate hydrolase [Phycicoccus flavus]